MKKILTFVILLNSLLLASSNEKNDSEKKSRIEKQIQKEMEREKKYAKEQTFYTGKEYDLKGAEVNPDSLSSVPELKVDDLDMDDVYD
ncbi:MAG: hypothetical protein U9Q62_05610 [Campylobacterota bacterium]|nr:hypothetical protein [Campylobacterota bacterium]